MKPRSMAMSRNLDAGRSCLPQTLWDVAEGSPARPCFLRVLALWSELLSSLQGVSTAGHQLGLGDGRTVLIKEVFRIWDTLPRRLLGNPMLFRFQCLRRAFVRQFLFLENVKAILTENENMHGLMRFLIEASRGYCILYVSDLACTGVRTSRSGAALGIRAHAQPWPPCHKLKHLPVALLTTCLNFYCLLRQGEEESSSRRDAGSTS